MTHVSILSDQEKEYKKAEAAVYRMVKPKKRSGKIEACDEIRRRWHESSKSKRGLVLEMLKCSGDKAVVLSCLVCCAAVCCFLESLVWQDPSHETGDVQKASEEVPDQLPAEETEG